jgi:hypothetical protein
MRAVAASRLALPRPAFARLHPLYPQPLEVQLCSGRTPLITALTPQSNSPTFMSTPVGNSITMSVNYSMLALGKNVPAPSSPTIELESGAVVYKCAVVKASKGEYFGTNSASYRQTVDCSLPVDMPASIYTV